MHLVDYSDSRPENIDKFKNIYPVGIVVELIAYSYCSETVGSLQWGRDHEKRALTDFVKEHKIEVCPAGLFLFKNGFLGATPDGLTHSVS